MVSVFEEASEFAGNVPKEEWVVEDAKRKRRGHGQGGNRPGHGPELRPSDPADPAIDLP